MWNAFVNRPLRVQLFTGIILLAGAGVLGMVGALRAAMGADRANQSAYENSLLPIATVGQLQGESQRLRSLYRDVAFDTASRIAALDAMNETQANVDSLVSQLAKSPDSTIALRALEFQKRLAAAQPFVEGFIAESMSGNTAAAFAILHGDLSATMTSAQASLDSLVITQSAQALQSTVASRASSQRSALIAATVFLLGLIAAMSVAMATTRRTVRLTQEVQGHLSRLSTITMSGMHSATSALAEGDLSKHVEVDNHRIEVSSRDELGSLGTSVNEILERTSATVQSYERASAVLQSMLDETQRVVTASTAGSLSATANAGRFPGAFGALLRGFNDAQEATRRPVEDALSVLERAAARDLSFRVDGSFQGDHARLTDAVNLAIGNLSTALHEVEVAAEQIAGASAQVAEGSQSLADGASAQAASIEEIAAAVQEQASVTTRTAGHAQEAHALASQARERARTGSHSMQELDAAMIDMAESVRKTAQIVKRIDEISFQTNLLALNAAVEAARAGDAGRGFAVVADEVRQLAIRAAQAASETSELIEQTLSSTSTSTTISKQVGEHLGTVQAEIERVTTVVSEIASDCIVQRDQTSEIRRSLEMVSQLTQGSAANAEESASASEELSAQSATMKELVQRFIVQDSMESPRKLARRDPTVPPPAHILEQRSRDPLVEKWAVMSA